MRGSADEVAMRHATEDADEKALLDKAAPLAAKLRGGINYFEPQEFRDLACFFLEGRARRDALDEGTFSVMRKIQIVRVRVGNLLTVSELSRAIGIAQQTLWRWVSKSNLPFRTIGNKKLYNINDVQQHLLTACQEVYKGLR